MPGTSKKCEGRAESGVMGFAISVVILESQKCLIVELLLLSHYYICAFLSTNCCSVVNPHYLSGIHSKTPIDAGPPRIVQNLIDPVFSCTYVLSIKFNL